MIRRNLRARISGRTALALITFALIGVLAVGVPATLLWAQDKPPKPGSGKPADDKKPQPGTRDEGQALLAAEERARGPQNPGKDPAFIVLPRAAERSRMALQLLGFETKFSVKDPKTGKPREISASVRDMIDKGLEYLVTKQDPNGGWSDTQFESNTGVTALCCLAFMAEGSRPRVGKYGKPMDRGLEFILRNVQTSGVIAGGKGNYELGPMYEHAYSMLALLYAYGDMPWRPQTQDVISRGIQAIARSQKLDGGWRYSISREGAADMSVTANVLWVMRTAKKSGFTVSSDAVAKGVKYVQHCATPDGTFRYRVWGLHASPSLGGTGVIALCNDGRLDHPLIPAARDRIAYDYRRYTVEDFITDKQRRYVVYGCFYASLAMYVCGDTFWIPWYEKAVRILASLQRKDGEFPDEHDNTIYSTAMALMVLQAPYGYLPLYER
jgi:hypothetical protein